MFNTLLATRLSIPPLRPNLVHRARLTASLDEALRLNQRLILVAAPAGFGKTTLVTEWLHGCQRSAAWLALEASDNDPLRFWRYLIAAVQRMEPAAGCIALNLLDSPEPAPLENALTVLLNDLAAQAEPLIIVLDDYQNIEAEAVHASLNFFLDHLPEQVCLVILTRVDPPLALARRRSRAQLAETRSADLRFTLAETTDFFNSTAGLTLEAPEIVALDRRTEGWAAGLQLAAHSLVRSNDRRAFVRQFAGDDHYVVDYLVEEVLQQQAQETRDFLLQTSILEHFNAALCSALTGNQASQEILSGLDQANLFIIPLDSRHTWYRYHALFADLLRWRLRQTASPAQIAGLQRRASRWYASEGLVSEAIACAVAANDVEEALRLLEEHALEIFYRSETRLVHQWLKALPPDALRANPLLCAVYANTIALAPPYPPGSLPLAETWLDDASRALAALPAAEIERHDLAQAFIATFGAFLARYQGQPTQVVIQRSLQALDLLPAEEQRFSSSAPNSTRYLKFRGALWNNISITHWNAGQVSQAIQASIQARRLSEAGGDLFNAFSAIYLQASLERRQGRLVESERLCREAIDSILTPLSELDHPAPYAGAVYIALGQVLLEWNRLEEAGQALERGLALIERTLGPLIHCEGFLALARWKQALGDAEGAFNTLHQAETLWTGARSLTAAQQARLWLAGDPIDLDSAARWASALGAAGRSLSADSGEYNAELLTLARVRIALHKRLDASLADVFDFLKRQSDSAVTSAWVEWQIELALIRALAHKASGDIAAALSDLRQAIDLGRPGGYLRIFANEGGMLKDLLLQLAASENTEDRYLRQILAAFPVSAPALPAPAITSAPAAPSASAGLSASAAPPASTGGLVEPLSPREIEVLHLVAAGASNAEIAQRLVISPNTAKKHVVNLMGKLGVSNRIEAILRARELKIIP